MNEILSFPRQSGNVLSAIPVIVSRVCPHKVRCVTTNRIAKNDVSLRSHINHLQLLFSCKLFLYRGSDNKLTLLSSPGYYHLFCSGFSDRSLGKDCGCQLPLSYLTSLRRRFIFTSKCYLLLSQGICIQHAAPIPGASH